MRKVFIVKIKISVFTLSPTTSSPFFNFLLLGRSNCYWFRISSIKLYVILFCFPFLVIYHYNLHVNIYIFFVYSPPRDIIVALLLLLLLFLCVTKLLFLCFYMLNQLANNQVQGNVACYECRWLKLLLNHMTEFFTRQAPIFYYYNHFSLLY
jgi:hypothetical protein